MPSSVSLLDLAIEVILRWGPEMKRPVVTRIREQAPEVDAERAASLEAEGRAIVNDVFAVAAQAWNEEMTPEEGRADVGRRYPQLLESTLDHAWSQGGYYAWHG